MQEDFHNKISRLWPVFRDRVGHDIHHFGAALVPLICEKLIWVVFLSISVFLALTALQAILEDR